MMGARGMTRGGHRRFGMSRPQGHIHSELLMASLPRVAVSPLFSVCCPLSRLHWGTSRLSTFWMWMLVWQSGVSDG